MDKRTEIHTGVSKEDAYELMMQGHKIRHEYYTDDEYLYMKNGIIYDENEYRMGYGHEEFWQRIQKWEMGWSTINGA
jgi:hypothetical protein